MVSMVEQFIPLKLTKITFLPVQMNFVYGAPQIMDKAGSKQV